MRLGANIRTMRKKCGCTQEQFGIEVGVTKGTVSAWEKDMRIPSISTYQKILDTYRRITGENPSEEFFIDQPTPVETEEERKNEDFLDNTDLSSWGFKYTILDEYGQTTVESVIRTEFARCLKNSCLESSEEYAVTVSSISGGQLIQTDESAAVGEIIKKFVRLDTWGKAIVEHTIKVCQDRCSDEKYVPNYRKLVVDVSRIEK